MFSVNVIVIVKAVSKCSNGHGIIILTWHSIGVARASKCLFTRLKTLYMYFNLIDPGATVQV